MMTSSALLPVHRRGHLVLGRELHRIEHPQNLIEVAAGAHRIAEHQLDLLVGTDHEHGAHGGVVAAVRPSEVSPASAGSMS